MIDESLLLKHRFFRDIGEPLLGYIAGCAEQVSYPADTQLLAQGQPAHSMLAIEHGKVGVGIHVPQRGFVTIETVQAGEIVGWSWLFPPYEWSFDAITTTDVSGILVHAQCIQPHLNDDPAVGLEFVERISKVMQDRLHSARLRLLDMYGDHE